MLNLQENNWSLMSAGNLECAFEQTLQKLRSDNKLSDKTQLLLALNYQLLEKHHGQFENITPTKKRELANLLCTEAQAYENFDLPKSLACYLISFFYASGTIDSPEARKINGFLGQTIASCVDVNRLH